jgi:hypothetical protein
MIRKTYSANLIDKTGIVKGCVYCSVYKWVNIHVACNALVEVKKEYEVKLGESLTLIDLRRI